MFMRSILTDMFLQIMMISCFTHGAAAAPTREQQVRDDKKHVEADSRWVYNDYNKAVIAAQKQKKPILLVFR